MPLTSLSGVCASTAGDVRTAWRFARDWRQPCCGRTGERVGARTESRLGPRTGDVGGACCRSTASDLGTVAGIESAWNTDAAAGRVLVVRKLAGPPRHRQDPIRGWNGATGGTEKILSANRINRWEMTSYPPPGTRQQPDMIRPSVAGRYQCRQSPDL